MVNPVPGKVVTTAYKKAGRLWSLGWHTGDDYAADTGTPIVSATPGKVIAANAWDRSYGYKVIIRWGNYDVWYCHMPNGAAKVKVGQTVTAGQRIGSVGATGNVTGSHLHFELRVAGGGFAAANFRDPNIAHSYKATTSVTAVWGKPETWKIGSRGAAVTRLGERLVVHFKALGYAKPYQSGPGPNFTNTDKKAVAKFQRAQGWTGKNADGFPGAETFRRLAATPTPKPTPKPPKPAVDLLDFGTFNFPDATKIKTETETERIKEAVRRIKYRNLHVIGLQEMVGRTAKDGPSSLAERFHKALGVTTWEIVVPTTDFNENYFFVQKRYAKVIRQFSDEIIRGTYKGVPISGRHVTRVQVDTLFGPVNFGNTHLISNNRGAAEVQAKLAVAALVGMGNTIPHILAGDFNTPGPLTALSAAGLKNARKTAQSSTAAQYATYTSQNSATPVINSDGIIDGIWHSDDLVTTKYQQYVRLDAKGKFTKPRASDHILVTSQHRKA